MRRTPIADERGDTGSGVAVARWRAAGGRVVSGLSRRVEGRPALAAIAVLNGVTGIAAAVALAPLSFGSDVDIFRRGSIGVAQGVIAPDFLYAPLFGILATPLTWPPPGVASVIVSLASATVLMVGVILETRGKAAVDRLLVALAALGFLPVVYELVAGQVTLFIAAAVYPVRNRDGWRRGIPLGVVLGLVPKPMLLPLLLWMLVYRRRALAAACLTAIGVLAAGLVLLGPDLYAAWAAALVGTGHVTRHGNLAITGIESPPLAIALWIATALVGLWATVRRETAGFVAAIVVALLIQPFTLTYAATILLVAVRPALRLIPRTTTWLSLVAFPAILTAFVPWMLAALTALTVRERQGEPDPERARG